MTTNHDTAVLPSAPHEDWRDAFLAQCEPRYSGHTRAAIASDLAVFLAWFRAENGEEFSPEKLTHWDLQGFRRHHVHECRRAAATWNRRLSTMRKLAHFFQNEGFIGADPTAEVRPMEIQDNQPKWLKRSDFGRFMRQVERNVNAARTRLQQKNALMDQAMIGLMVYAGLREFEVTGLRRADVVIRERSGHVMVHSGKGDKERMVPLGKEARRLVQPWLDYWKEERLFDISERWVQKRIKTLGLQASCQEDITPHRLRHTFGKRMVEKGVSIEKVAMLLGHNSIETTKIYVRPGFQDLAEAVELV